MKKMMYMAYGPVNVGDGTARKPIGSKPISQAQLLYAERVPWPMSPNSWFFCPAPLGS
jgi:hypothetical protein